MKPSLKQPVIALILLFVWTRLALTATAATPAAPLATPTVALYLPFVNKPSAVDLAVSKVEVIQGITMGDSHTVHVASRPTLLRAFVSLTGAASQSGVSARLTRYVAGTAQDSLTAGPITLQSTTNEGALGQTFNFSLPSNWLVAGTSYVLEIDPANTVAENSEGNNRYPAAGAQSFNFVPADPLTVVVVPVQYKGTLPNTGDLSYLTWMPLKVYPVSQITYELHPPIPFAGDLSLPDGSGWEALLDLITLAHSAEDPGSTKLYYGLVDSVAADGCNGGCIAGIGWVGSPSSAGFSGFGPDDDRASPIFTHEAGHNFGRWHSPCGTANGVDPAYPYPAASIGQWGYDTASAALHNPATAKDYMSYCNGDTSRIWTSDYTYKGVFDFRSSSAFGAASPDSFVEAHYFGGSVDAKGRLAVQPLYRQMAPVQAESGGRYRVELLDGKGNLLASRRFDMRPMAFDNTVHGGGEGQGFSFFMQWVEGAAALRIYEGDQLIFERAARGPAPALRLAGVPSRNAEGATLHWAARSGGSSLAYRVRFSPDGGQTWQALALNAVNASLNVPKSLLATATKPLVEVQATDGVRTDTLVIPLQ